MDGIFFGAGKAIAVPRFDSNGTAIAVPQPVVLAEMQEISVDISVDMKLLYGARRFPIAAGQGKGKIDIKAKSAKVSGAVMGQLFYGKEATAGVKGMMPDFRAKVPQEDPSITVVPPGGATFTMDLGVWKASAGGVLTQLRRVAGAPTAGQYAVDDEGQYDFAAADKGADVFLNYEYESADGQGEVFNLTNDLMGFTPSFSLLLRESTTDGGTLTIKFNSATSGKLSLPFKSDDWTVSDFEASAKADDVGDIGWMCLQRGAQ